MNDTQLAWYWDIRVPDVLSEALPGLCSAGRAEKSNTREEQTEQKSRKHLYSTPKARRSCPALETVYLRVS